MEVRGRVCGLLARMFAAKGSNLAQHYRHLFSTFLGRFKDKEVHIRKIMIEFAKHYLTSQRVYLNDVAGTNEKTDPG